VSELVREGDAERVLQAIDYFDLESNWLDAANNAAFTKLRAVLANNISCFVRYKPELFEERVNLLRATEGHPGLSGSLLADYASPSRSLDHFISSLETDEIGGNHFTLLSEPFCDALAAKIRRIVLDRGALLQASHSE
jgi:thioesterase domain-containing protein